MSDGGGHLALVPMLTLLHGRLRLPICKTGFYFGSGFGQKTPTLSIENIEKNPTNGQRAHAPEICIGHCASSDATFYPGMHGLTQDEGIISAHLCV